MDAVTLVLREGALTNLLSILTIAGMSIDELFFSLSMMEIGLTAA
jgi:hypothetical protein